MDALNRERILNWLFHLFLAVYLLLMLYLLFFMRITPGGGARSVNLVPLHSIRSYYTGAYNVSLWSVTVNLLGNVLVFVPLGVYLPLLRGSPRILPNLLLVTLCSVGAEAIQYLFALGAADVDDVLLNAAGGLVGILICWTLWKLLGEGRTRTAVTVISGLVGLPVLLIAAGVFLANR